MHRDIDCTREGMDNPRISIVVLNYNKREDLDRNLRRLREIPFESKEIIVVDNASTDGSVEMIREEFPEVKLIASPTNDGVAKGRNRGFRAARGEYVIYLDDDSVAPVDVCEQVVGQFEARPEVGCLAFLVREVPFDRFPNKYDDVEYLGNYNGAGHAFRKDCLERIGYLEEMYFFGGEEIDSSLALLNEGFKTRYTPEVVIDHYLRIHQGGEFSKRASNWFASYCWFYVKWFSWWQAGLLILRQVAVMTKASLARGTLMPPILGIGRFLKGLPLALRKRNVAKPEVRRFYCSPEARPRLFRSEAFRRLLNLFDHVKSKE
jgi:GT2 family glycosyltransferase